MQEYLSVAKLVQSVITSLTILVGGCWAYFKFIKGRVYRPRLELGVNCEVYSHNNNVVYLHIKATLKNLGLSKVSIDKESSSIRLYMACNLDDNDSLSETAFETEWARIGTFSILDEHDWIEPTEVIQSQKMLQLLGNNSIFRVETIVMSDKQQWCSSCICFRKSDDN